MHPMAVFSVTHNDWTYRQAANDRLTRSYIDDAGGYGKISAVYDSISGESSVVVVGWDT